MSSALQDQEARDQAENDLTHTLFVEASAGTGKTTMLVQRVINLIVSGTARIEQVAAITFTEAAAAELRDRLSEKLEVLASQGNLAALDAVSSLDSAAITTLHGFARRILAEQPFAAGLPPLFEVTDRSSALVAFDERWQRFVARLFEDPADEDLMVRALSCCFEMDRLRDGALMCEENWDRLGIVPDRGAAPNIDPTDLGRYLKAALNLRSACADDEDRLLRFLNGVIAPAEVSLAMADSPIESLQLLVGVKPLASGNKGRKDSWLLADGSNGKDAVADLLERAEAERIRLVDGTVQWVLTSLFGRIVASTLLAADERRTSGRLTFLDLLVLARNLVRDHPDARSELHDRYRHILIDEFQDTDPIQAELAMYLATGADVESQGDWSSLPVPQGRLFFVGDPKQSIYRFRRADIDLFMSTRRHMVTEALQLKTNFRSRPAIVSWVNSVFGTLFGVGVEGKQPHYQALLASEDKGCDNDRGLKPVIVLGQEPTSESADQVREAQASDVVAAIGTMHAEGWKMGPNGEPFRYADVAVLVRTRTGLPILERAFQTAGIPCRLESSSLVYKSNEVQDLIAILRAVGDPTDSVSLLAALRSPAFGCGDDDLLHHAAAGGRWDTRDAQLDGTPVGDALAILNEYHRDTPWHSVSALVSHVVQDRRLLTLSLYNARARESWRRIRFVIDQARLFDEVDGGDLRGFLRWVGHQQQEDANVTEAILPESDDDAVRIITVHAAKGLEFPVVVMLGLQTAPQARRPSLLFTPTGFEVHVKEGMETPGYAGVLEHEKEMESFERHRLLYVAATRARDVLLVSLHRGERSEKSLAAELSDLCQLRPELWSDGAALCEPRTQSIPPSTDGVGFADSADARARFVEERAQLLAREAQSTTIAATGVQHLASIGGWTDDIVEPAERSVDSSVHHRGRAGTAVGRAVHAVLQVIDLKTGEGVGGLARAQAVAEGVADRSDEVEKLVRSALASDLILQAMESGRYWREVYVGVPVQGRTLEGFIDLLFETPDGLAIVDYKTDRLPEGDDGSAIAARYRWQGASYALAVQRALGRPIASCSFLVLHANGATQAAIADLERAMGEVSELLGAPAV